MYIDKPKDVAVAGVHHGFQGRAWDDTILAGTTLTSFAVDIVAQIYA